MSSWYYMESGQTRGPVDDDAIRVLASAGRLNPASSLMMAGSSEWSTVGAFEAILGLQRTPSGSYAPAGAPMPPPPPPPGYAAPPPGYAPPPPGYAAPPPGYGGGSPYGVALPPMTVFGQMASPWWKRAVALIIDTLVLVHPTQTIILNIFGGFETYGQHRRRDGAPLEGPGFLSRSPSRSPITLAQRRDERTDRREDGTAHSGARHRRPVDRSDTDGASDGSS